MRKGPKMANICVFEEVKESFMDRVQTVRVSDGRWDGSSGQGNVVGEHLTQHIKTSAVVLWHHAQE